MYVLAATFDWQGAGAGLIVLAAAAYLARRAWLVARRPRTTGCGACANCRSEHATTELPLVALDSLTGSARREPIEPTLLG